jgi:DNA mismatch endonuclease (patch repair protein)
MQGNRSRDTTPEIELRRLVHSSGLRYRVNARPLPSVRRTADMVFRPAKVAVFVDGCFWHRCPDHATDPKTNSDYWKPKLERNVERDRETDRLLAESGWLSIRIWEHEDLSQAALQIAKTVRQRREDLRALPNARFGLAAH